MDKNILYHRTATQLNILKAFGANEIYSYLTDDMEDGWDD